MRTDFSVTIEAGRERRGAYGSEAGERNGAFLVRCPVTGEQLRIIVSDGSDWSEWGLRGEPWEHVSVSTPRRCPLWEEMAWVKDQFFEPSETVIEFHVPKSEHINYHPYVLHLWRPTVSAIPMPPGECVGPKTWQ